MRQGHASRCWPVADAAGRLVLLSDIVVDVVVVVVALLRLSLGLAEKKMMSGDEHLLSTSHELSSHGLQGSFTSFIQNPMLLPKTYLHIMQLTNEISAFTKGIERVLYAQ